MNAKKIAAFAIGPIGSAALGFITLPLITWFYSAEDVGRIAMLQVLLSFCVLVFALGLDQAYVRNYHDSQNKPSLLKTSLTPGFLLLIIASVCALLFPGAISELLFGVKSTLISVVIVSCMLAALVSRFLSLVLRMQEKGLAFSLSQLLPKIVFIFILVTYITFSFGNDFRHLIIAHAISIITVTIIFAWNTRQVWLAAYKEPIDQNELTTMLSFGMPLIVGGAAFWGLTAIDRLFLRSFSTFEELGVYSVASSFAAVAIIFQSVFSTVWAPTVYRWASEGLNNEKIDSVTEHVLATVVFIFILAGLFSGVVSYILPKEYGNVQYILVACMAYPLFYTLSETTVVGLGITRKSSYAMIASLLAVLVNLIGNYLLVPKYGAAGASVSTAIAFWIFLVCRTEFSCISWRQLPRTKLYSVTFACLIACVGTSLCGSNYPSLAVFPWILIGCTSLYIFRSSIGAARAEFIRQIQQ
ncbi:oligosaccharide flippase family protein [Pseudomonas gregormendelii]|uniref:Oligosaccharide flippase family protein n=1 Tax=Pseudomonas gregormendelii TaxID=1628277 RepID=A0ABS3AIH3_9PSED|nr:oligosaccharide flippase family protein [Pseudomonas gregormendelii]MBN3966972.1 oligosaccharide flippase family protein [Pseudomonas gregormendelii]